MRRWLRNAHPEDILPVGGPAPYSIHDLEGRELSDHWEQALVMKELTERPGRRYGISNVDLTREF